MRRNWVRKEDKTTANGIVIEGLEDFWVDGRRATYIGAKVSCPACKSTGYIVATGPRLSNGAPTLWGNRETALHGDLCACRCHPPPTLISSQNDTYIECEGTADEEMIYGQSALTSSVIDSIHENFSAQFTLKSASGKVLANHPYVMESEQGHRHEGVTDASGKTVRIFTDQAENFNISHRIQSEQAEEMLLAVPERVYED